MVYSEALIYLFIGAAIFGVAAWFYFVYVWYRAEKRYMAYKMKLLLNHDYETFKQVCEMEMREFVKEGGRRNEV